MEVDLVLACLLTLLGAALMNLADCMFEFTPRLAAWIADRMRG